VKRIRPIALREPDLMNAAPKVFLNDKPSMNGDIIIFVSTEEDVGIRVQGWTAIFSLNMKTSVIKRLTPPGITDYSPAVSPSGTHLHQLVDFLFAFSPLKQFVRCPKVQAVVALS
jgi:hypothetical protein